MERCTATNSRIPIREPPRARRGTVVVAMVSQDLDGALIEYLSDAHALEQMGLRVLEEGCRVDPDETTVDIYRAHHQQTRGHLRLIDERLMAHHVSPPAPSEAAVRVAGLQIAFNPDGACTPAELAISAYTLENLEIGVYHALRGLARRLHDHETEIIAQQILEQEEDAAELVASRIDRALPA
jgi:ferritin-like metal-binding protein YciE